MEDFTKILIEPISPSDLNLKITNSVLNDENSTLRSIVLLIVFVGIAVLTYKIIKKQQEDEARKRNNN